MTPLEQAQRRRPLAELRRQGELFVRWLITLYRAHLPSHILKQFSSNRSLQVASALAYQTILSLVPLIVVGFSILNAFGGPESSAGLLTYTLENLIPIEASSIEGILRGMPSLSSPQAVGVVGVITLLILSTTLLSNIERALNDVWRVRGQRSFVSRFATYYTILTLAPVLLSLGIYQATRVTEASHLAARVLPSVLTFGAFFVCYKILPQPRTRWRPALVGALLANALFELSKWAFALYVSFAAGGTYASIYGAIGLLPLFLIWVYVSWIVFLFGGQAAYSVQNLELLAELDIHQDPERRSEELFDQTTDEAAIRLFFEISVAFQRGEAPPSEEDLAIAIPMPEFAVRFLVERFLQRGLLLQVGNTGLVPSRPPSGILVLDLVEGLRAPRVPLDISAMPSPLRAALDGMRAGRQKALAGTTFADLMPRLEARAAVLS